MLVSDFLPEADQEGELLNPETLHETLFRQDYQDYQDFFWFSISILSIQLILSEK